MQITLSIGEVIAFFGVLISALSVFGGLLFALWRRIVKNSDNLSSYKLYVAERYASIEHISGMEQKLIASEERTLAAINNLTSRIDRMLTRWETRDN